MIKKLLMFALLLVFVLPINMSALAAHDYNHEHHTYHKHDYSIENNALKHFFDHINISSIENTSQKTISIQKDYKVKLINNFNIFNSSNTYYTYYSKVTNNLINFDLSLSNQNIYLRTLRLRI